MSQYWIKLYHEILDDPKMALLPDRLWRRVVECFLLAGRVNENGRLPDTRKMAWMLRTSSDDLQTDLEQLAATGIITPREGGWMVPKFQERQAPSPAKERVRQYRERKRNIVSNDNVTETLRKVTPDTDTDTDTDTESLINVLTSKSVDTATTRELATENDVRAVIERLTGVPAQTPNDLKALGQIATLRPTAADLQQAVQWYAGQGKAVRYYSSLVGPTQTAKAQRVQAGNGFAPARKKKTYIDADGNRIEVDA